MISVCIPWAGNDPDRIRALAYVTERYKTLGYNVYVGCGDPDEWRKGAAVRAAVDEAPDYTLVIADADVWSDQIEQAVDSVNDGAAWAIPHWNVRRLTGDGTEQFMRGDPDDLPLEESHHGLAGGGIVVLRRGTYEEAPIDPRFVGWGSEDKAWARALRTLAGRPTRIDGTLWHLWHPPQQRLTRAVGSAENEELLRRYEEASLRPNAMRALIAEGREYGDRTVFRPRREDHPADVRH